MKTSFITLENKGIHLCSGLSLMSQMLKFSMASKKIGIPLSEIFTQSPPFPFKTIFKITPKILGEKVFCLQMQINLKSCVTLFS